MGKESWDAPCTWPSAVPWVPTASRCTALGHAVTSPHTWDKAMRHGRIVKDSAVYLQTLENLQS